MFVLNPDPYSLPVYRIGPFQTADVAFNHLLPEDRSVMDYFGQRFAGRDFTITTNGREAIYLALKFYGLAKDDLVTILTTSQNFYISSCVTREIEKFCQWNREIVPETKVIFVNHEFGTVYPHMDKLMATGLPIIEDCCTTFFSQDEAGRVGLYGDFAVYSFPKFYPIQIGGLLVNNKNKTTSPSTINVETRQYIQNVLSHHIKDEQELLEKRNAIYNCALNRYKKLGFADFFPQHKLQVPSVMMLKNNGIIKDLPALKTHLWNHGIQSSVFYGQDAFFIPSHQNLTETDVEYFYSVMYNFMKQQ